jgi:ornithine decarboxylase
VNLNNVRSRIQFWNSCLPSIRPYYAVKCNNIPSILHELYKCGVGFDCASSDEIKAVSSFGTKPGDIIYANPCKSISELYTARLLGVQNMTFDNLYEIEKITEQYRGNARPILRIFIDDKGGSRIPLNKKFGMHIDQVDSILQREPRYHIFGIAFHVGSDCRSIESYKSAFATVREFLSVFSNAKHLFTPDILDIGGGFSGHSKNDVFFQEELAPFIRNEIKSMPFFKKIIAEPGRFFAEQSCTLHVPVIGRKTLPTGERCITVDDSVYGIFSGVLFDGFKPEFKCISRDAYAEMKQFTVFGRTCDSADKIAEGVWLPAEINDTDILEVKNIGAYSWVSSSEFNGFPKPDIQVIS